MESNSDELMNAVKPPEPKGVPYSITPIRYDHDCAIFHVPHNEDAKDIWLQSFREIAMKGHEGYQMVGNPFPVGEGVAPYAKGQSTVIAETGPAEVVDLEGTYWCIVLKRELMPMPVKPGSQILPVHGNVPGLRQRK